MSASAMDTVKAAQAAYRLGYKDGYYRRPWRGYVTDSVRMYNLGRTSGEMDVRRGIAFGD